MTRFCMLLAVGAVLSASISSSAQTTPITKPAKPAAIKAKPVKATAQTPAANAKSASTPQSVQTAQPAQTAQPISTTPANTATPATVVNPAAYVQQMSPAQAASQAASQTATSVVGSAQSAVVGTAQSAIGTATQAVPSAMSAVGGSAQPGATMQPGAANRTNAPEIADRGTLAWGTRTYNPMGCVHNGSHAACTFTFVNQGNGTPLYARGPAELSGIVLVDDAHVPHAADNAYFVDKYGSQQLQLVVEKGDTGTYIETFPNVDPHVVTAEFHLRSQVIGGVNVAPPGSTPGQTAPQPRTP